MRRTRRLLTATASLAVAGAVLAAPAAAVPPVTQGASAYASAAATGTGRLSANLQLTGALGHLFDGVISPIVSGVLNPLVAALQGGVSSMADALLGASSTAHAGIPDYQGGSAQAAFPGETVPSPCVTSGAQPCYSIATGPTLNASPLASVSVGALSGWTQQVPSAADATNPIYGRARVARITVNALTAITALANPVVSSGLVDAKANCPNDGPAGASKPKTPPSALVSAAGVTLLGGVVKFDVLNGQITNLTVSGTSYNLLTLPTLNLPGGITVAPYGTSISVSVSLTATQVFSALGLASSVVSQLLSLSTGSTVTLTLIAGPTARQTNTTATAWGLGVGVDLSGALSFNLLGLVGAVVNLPTGITSSNNGNLVDLRFAYTTCQSGTTTQATVPPVPPALV